MQIHHQRSQRLGVMRAFLANSPKTPGYRVRWLGQAGQGLVFAQLSTAEQLSRTLWIFELCDRLSGRFFVCFRWQRLQGDVVGFERKQASVHFGPQGNYQCDVFLTEPVRQDQLQSGLFTLVSNFQTRLAFIWNR